MSGGGTDCTIIVTGQEGGGRDKLLPGGAQKKSHDPPKLLHAA